MSIEQFLNRAMAITAVLLCFTLSMIWYEMTADDRRDRNSVRAEQQFYKMLREASR